MADPHTEAVEKAIAEYAKRTAKPKPAAKRKGSKKK